MSDLANFLEKRITIYGRYVLEFFFFFFIFYVPFVNYLPAAICLGNDYPAFIWGPRTNVQQSNWSLASTLKTLGFVLL